MDDFGLSIDDFNNSKSFTAKIAEGFNPNGSSSLATSASKEKYVNQSLTSRDVIDIMAGRSIIKKSRNINGCK
jgi:hypothetical protein